MQLLAKARLSQLANMSMSTRVLSAPFSSQSDSSLPPTPPSNLNTTTATQSSQNHDSEEANEPKSVENNAEETDRLISIDRSGLIQPPSSALSTLPTGTQANSNVEKEEMTPLGRLMMMKIQSGGPVTMSEWISSCLTLNDDAYYMNRDVFGRGGDFTTSPEISQFFGEALGVWMLHAWTEGLGKSEKLRLVEIGPGRGTLCDDVLRVMVQFPGLAENLAVHLVEVSPALREMQQDKLKVTSDGKSETHGVSVEWHEDLSWLAEEEADTSPILMICHEFFDALPVHQFQGVTSPKGPIWRERLVDVEQEGSESKEHFRGVLAPIPTPALAYLHATQTLLPFAAKAQVDQVVEVCPQGWVVMEQAATAIARCGGAMLAIDYGSGGPHMGDTLRAVARHGFVSPFATPGQVDLSARVDFGSLLEVASRVKGIHTWDTVSQTQLLAASGIETMARNVLAKVDDEKTQAMIVSGVNRVMDPDGMGGEYVAAAFTSWPEPPPGFSHRDSD